MHHIFYRNDWHDAQVNDLIPLCECCHELAHIDTLAVARVDRKIEEEKRQVLTRRLRKISCWRVGGAREWRYRLKCERDAYVRSFAKFCK